MKDKHKFSLDNTLSLAKAVKINTPKNMLIENETLLKFKNLVTDYPEYNLSPTKLLNVIALNWLEEHRDELIQNHLLTASKRY